MTLNILYIFVTIINAPNTFGKQLIPTTPAESVDVIYVQFNKQKVDKYKKQAQRFSQNLVVYSAALTLIYALKRRFL